ncbi:hypothetical protein SSX86_030024 [Deinandra increscens subsp. villosa]|uniref:Uncharacterized protein n=1 Tax=Deinandra increscens subsp. villosa TaxID=3103831 RepID=A0AAP0CCG4_9ASTR
MLFRQIKPPDLLFSGEPPLLFSLGPARSASLSELSKVEIQVLFRSFYHSHTCSIDHLLRVCPFSNQVLRSEKTKHSTNVAPSTDLYTDRSTIDNDWSTIDEDEQVSTKTSTTVFLLCLRDAGVSAVALHPTRGMAVREIPHKRHNKFVEFYDVRGLEQQR